MSAGIDDLRTDRETAPAALVSMAASRLRATGLDVPHVAGRGLPHHHLYELLSVTDPASAHSRYNALVGRIVSFARAAEHARGG